MTRNTTVIVTLIVTLIGCSVVSDFDGYAFAGNDAGADVEAFEDAAAQLDAGADVGALDAAPRVDGGHDASALDAATQLDAGADVGALDAAAQLDAGADAAIECCGGGCPECGGVWRCMSQAGALECQPFPCFMDCP